MINQFRGKYYFLSNFYERKIIYNGITYRNNEAAFHAQKSLSDSERFSNLTGAESKRLGRKVLLRKDWDTIKEKLMYEICLCKFTQHEDLKNALLMTGNKKLEEGNTWNDCYWGVCNGVGQNKLGEILMKIRNELNLKKQ